MKFTYEQYTKILLIGIGAAFLILAALMILDVDLIPIIVYAAVFLAAIIFVGQKEKSMFPQWRGLRWRIPSPMILFMLGVFIGLLLAENLMDTDSPLLTLGIFVAGMLAPLQNYRKAKQFHMDELNSIEELKQRYPEAAEDIVVK